MIFWDMIECSVFLLEDCFLMYSSRVFFRFNVEEVFKGGSLMKSVINEGNLYIVLVFFVCILMFFVSFCY